MGKSRDRDTSSWPRRAMSDSDGGRSDSDTLITHGGVRPICALSGVATRVWCSGTPLNCDLQQLLSRWIEPTQKATRKRNRSSSISFIMSYNLPPQPPPLPPIPPPPLPDPPDIPPSPPCPTNDTTGAPMCSSPGNPLAAILIFAIPCVIVFAFCGLSILSSICRARRPHNVSLRWIQAQQRVEIARTELREKLLGHLLTENDVRLINPDPGLPPAANPGVI
ncbi:hypothetical protein BC827DRAFT_846415 [Russula dissimulans]|nr:hypothetical protein BC827DRAFT_846415 [Russula dissimulans]